MEDEDVEGLGLGEELAAAMGAGTAFSTIFTPLFQTNLLPDFMHVYLYPLTIEVELTLVHVPPAFTAADAETKAELPRSAIIHTQSNVLFISQLYVATIPLGMFNELKVFQYAL